MTELVVFQPTELATFGNKILHAIVNHDSVKEAAEQALAAANEEEGFIDLELTKVAMFLHKEEKLDLYRIYGDSNQDSAILYRSILTEMGALKKEITKDDKVEYTFTDPSLADQFYFPTELKETDEAEYKRRRSRRNALNIRLARCVKAAISLTEAGATTADIVYRQNEAGKTEAVITKGPAQILGKKTEAVIHTKNTAKLEGATETPTIGGLAKVADASHKTAPAKADAGEGTTRKEGEGGTTEADLLALLNTVMIAVNGREGQFNDAEKTAMKNLTVTLGAALKG